MKLVVVTPNYPRWSGDSNGPVAANIARLLHAAGHQVTVVTIHYAGTPLRETMAGVEVVRARYAPDSWEVLGTEGGIVDDLRGSWRCRLLLLPMVGGLMARVCRCAWGADALLVQWVPTAITALPAAIFLRKPIVLQSHTFADTPFWRLVYRLLLRLAAVVVYNSAANQASTQRLYRHARTVVIPPGVELAAFARPPAGGRGDSTWFTLVSVSRLIEVKGVEYAISALALLRDRGRRVRLEIVGDGPRRAALERLGLDLRLTEEIRFHGALAYASVPAILWRGDAFLLSSIVDSKGRTEGFGTVILEAMAAGLPVIASAVGGIVEIIRDGDNGLLVPPGDPAAIAAAVERLIDDPTAAVGLQTRAAVDVAARYSDAAITSRYESVLGSLRR